MPAERIEILIQIIGWTGSVEILLAYALNSYEKIKPGSLPFAMLNLTGGILLIAYTICKEAYASTFINFVWVIIAGISLWKFYRKKFPKNAQA
jgi:hypothetical protein